MKIEIGKEYRIQNKFKKGYEQDLHEAITDWEKLRTGKNISGDCIQRIASYMGVNNFNKFRIKFIFF